MLSGNRIASIFHAKLFDKTRELRVNNKKDYTFPAIIDQLDMIPADNNLTTGEYGRRYAPTKKQTAILNALGLTYANLDQIIADMV